jgi:hypothetical protein
MNISNLSKRIAMTNSYGYSSENIINILSSQPYKCSDISVTDCQTLFLYAACNDNIAYTRFQLLNGLYPEIPETGQLLDKYSIGVFLLVAKNCIENNGESLIDVTHKVNQLISIADDDLNGLLSIIDASTRGVVATPVKNLLYLLAGAALTIGYLVHTTDKYYRAYKRCING